MLDNDSSVRQMIRDATRADHDRLDAQVSRLDLARSSDLAVFFAMNRLGFAAIADAPFSPRIVSRQGLVTLIGALDADLATLDRAAPPPLPPCAPLQSAAVDHVVLGSRLGTKVLRGRWQSGSDPRALAATAYFATPSMVAEWHAHLAQLKSESDVDTLIRDIGRLFAVFEDALKEAAHVA